MFSLKVQVPHEPNTGSRFIDSLLSISDSAISRVGGIRRATKKHSILGSVKRGTTRSTNELDYVSEQKECFNKDFEAKIIKVEEVGTSEESEAVLQVRKNLKESRKIKLQKKNEQLAQIKKQREIQDKVKEFERQKKGNEFTFDYEGNVIFVKQEPLKEQKASNKYNLNLPLKIIQQGTDVSVDYLYYVKIQ